MKFVGIYILWPFEFFQDLCIYLKARIRITTSSIWLHLFLFWIYSPLLHLFFLDINYTWLKYLRNHDHHHFLSSFFYFGITLDKNSDYFIEKMRGRREKHVAYYRSDIHWVLSIWILMFVLRAFTYIQMFRLNKSKCNIVCQGILCTCNHSSRCVYIFAEYPLQYSLKGSNEC